MNLPNKISLTRLCLTVVMVALFLLGASSILPYGELYATGVYIVAAVTDFVDGYLARSRGLVTTLGKFLDSISDKVLCLAAFIFVGCVLRTRGCLRTVTLGRRTRNHTYCKRFYHQCVASDLRKQKHYHGGRQARKDQSNL